MQKIEHNSLCETESYKGMTDNEIIKSLESLLDKMRAYEASQASIGKGVVEDIISMYDRQKAEIERLQAEAQMADGYAEALEQKAKTEAIKEFADRLKCNASILCDRVTSLPCSYTISNYNFNRLVKEMTEASEK